MRRSGYFDSFSTVLEGLARRLGLETKLLENRLRRDWPSVVGEPVASNTWPDQIRYKKLYLLVHNSVWMHQLMYLKPALLQKLNAVAGDNLVTDIVLRVGEIPSREVVSDTAPASDCDSTLSEILVSEAASYVSAIQDPDLRLQFTSVISKNLRPPAQPGRGPSRVP